MNLVRVLPLLVAAPVVLSVTPAIGDPIASAGFFIVASVPATQTVIYCRSLPTGIGDLKVISGPASSDARAASDAARASRPAGPAGFSLAGALAEPARGALDVSFSLADAAPARLELLDVLGRRVQTIEVGDLGPGGHVARLAPVPAPGV
jgi:hypothetical protein